jgi:APA family basic amino acid/polyamine antiporter
MFVCAKSASAATAALGFAGYLLRTLDRSDSRWQIAIALAAVVMLTLVVLAGVKRSNRANTVIVGLTFVSLIAFVIAGLAPAIRNTPDSFKPFFTAERNSFAAFLHASALMFVAYTGYGRIATLGEEVHEPRRNIPIAIIATLIASTALYVAVAFVAVATIGAAALGEAASTTAAPLEVAAESFGTRLLAQGVAFGAMTAMLGVLLNLILGLSRVLLAMGRRGDMPAAVARLNSQQTTPPVAVVVVGLMIGSIVAIGSVKVAWSFSAFTVLIYYAITNLAAIRMPPMERRFHPIIAWLGLGGCLGLAFWVDARVWAIGLALISVGLLWRLGMRASAVRHGDGMRNRTGD